MCITRAFELRQVLEDGLGGGGAEHHGHHPAGASGAVAGATLLGLVAAMRPADAFSGPRPGHGEVPSAGSAAVIRSARSSGCGQLSRARDDRARADTCAAGTRVGHGTPHRRSRRRARIRFRSGWHRPGALRRLPYPQLPGPVTLTDRVTRPARHGSKQPQQRRAVTATRPATTFRSIRLEGAFMTPASSNARVESRR